LLGAVIDAAAMPPRARLIRSGILLFWAAWFTVVALTNLLDALKALGFLPAGFTLASGNWALMLKVTAIHGTPASLVALLFLGVILWEAVAAALFWRAWAVRGEAIATAFIVGLALWAAFTLADEVFIAYPLEAVHLRLFAAQLLSLLAIRLLPDD
jgi:hypothetical protein